MSSTVGQVTQGGAGWEDGDALDATATGGASDATATGASDATAQADPAATATATVAAEGLWTDTTGAASRLQASLGAGGSCAAAAPDTSLAGRFSSWLGGEARSVGALGASLSQKAGALEGKVGDAVTGSLHALADTAAATKDALASAATGAAKDTTAAISDAHARLSSAADTASTAVASGLADLSSAYDATKAKVVAGLNDAAGVVNSLKEKAVALGDAVSRSLDPTDDIKSLKTDDSTLTIGLGAKAEVEVSGHAKGEVEVKRVDDPKPHYEVKVSGEVGAGLIAELGGKAGAEADAKAEGELSAKGAFTFDCESPEDAARVVKIAGRMAAAAEVGTAAPGVGTLAAMAIAPGSDDMKFLADHAESMEVGGELAGSISAELGAGLDKGALRLVGGDAEAAAKLEKSVELKFPRDGKPAQVIVKSSGEVGADASASIGLGKEGPGLGAKVGGKLGVELEQTFTLPASIDMQALKAHPLDTIKGVAGEVAKDEEDKVTLTRSFEASGGLKLGGSVGKGTKIEGEGPGASAEVEAEVSFEGKPQAIAGAVGAALKTGDIKAALGALDKNVECEAKVEGKATHGFSIAPEIRIEGVGVGVEAKYETADAKEIAKLKGSPSEVVKKMLEGLSVTSASEGGSDAPASAPTPMPAPAPTLVMQDGISRVR